MTTLTPTVGTVFGHLEAGDFFVIPRYPNCVYKVLGYAQVRRADMLCTRYKSTPESTLNTVSPGGIVVHFCPDVEVILLGVYTKPLEPEYRLVRIVDDNSVTWEWNIDKNWLDVEYSPSDERPGNSGYFVVDAFHVVYTLVDGGSSRTDRPL